MALEEAEPPVAPGSLTRALEALANPVRIDLLHRLGRPAFVPDLAQEMGITRQALKKHLDALEEVGLIVAVPSRRGALPATEYRADPAGLFAFKDAILGLALHTDPSSLPPAPTREAAAPPTPGGQGSAAGSGLLMIHGDQPGRWFGLSAKASWVIGRDARSDIALAYDPFVSARHAMLQHSGRSWVLTDLHATNPTRLNFRPVPAGSATPIRPGDLLTIGRTHLLLRDGP